MGRPREHDLDDLLDHARRLWVRDGIAGVTVRALQAASGVSNGAIYHAVGSRDALLVRVWDREAAAFLAHQRGAVEAAGDDSVEALVAAAVAPATFAASEPEGAALLLSVKADDLVSERLDPDDLARLRRHKRALGALVRSLAAARWDRTDRPALALVTQCVVDLPAALLLSRGRVGDRLARHALETAVRAIAMSPIPD